MIPKSKQKRTKKNLNNSALNEAQIACCFTMILFLRYLLIDESPDRRMNKVDTFGQTPMYCAAKNGNITVHIR